MFSSDSRFITESRLATFFSLTILQFGIVTLHLFPEPPVSSISGRRLVYMVKLNKDRPIMLIQLLTERQDKEILGPARRMLSHTIFYIANLKYQRLRTKINSKLRTISTNILVITLTVLVIFLPVSALSTSEARSVVQSGFPNEDSTSSGVVQESATRTLQYPLAFAPFARSLDLS